jgi:hypothetical protein
VTSGLRNTDWVRCPECGEVFRGNQQDFGSLLGSTADNSNIKGRIKVRPVSESNPDTGYEASLKPAWEKTEDPRPVSRSSRSFRAVCLVIFILGLAALLGGPFVLGFRSAEMPLPPLDPLPASKVPDYAGEVLPGDLKALKAELLRARRSEKNIGFQGYESRIYRYLAEQLAPGSCQEITELFIYSDDTSEGFTARGVCYNRLLKAAEITVTWSGDSVRVEAEGEEGYIEFFLTD